MLTGFPCLCSSRLSDNLHYCWTKTDHNMYMNSVNYCTYNRETYMCTTSFYFMYIIRFLTFVLFSPTFKNNDAPTSPLHFSVWKFSHRLHCTILYTIFPSLLRKLTNHAVRAVNCMILTHYYCWEFGRNLFCFYFHKFCMCS